MPGVLCRTGKRSYFHCGINIVWPSEIEWWGLKERMMISKLFGLKLLTIFRATLSHWFYIVRKGHIKILLLSDYHTPVSLLLRWLCIAIKQRERSGCSGLFTFPFPVLFFYLPWTWSLISRQVFHRFKRWYESSRCRPLLSTDYLCRIHTSELLRKVCTYFHSNFVSKLILFAFDSKRIMNII